MRSFTSDEITVPVAFKAIRYGRRVQIWKRQASIITDLTTLALRHGWHCLQISNPCARDALRSLVASSSGRKNIATRDPIPPMNTYYATILVEDVEIGRYVTADNYDAAFAQAETRTQLKHPRAHILVRALQLLNSGVPDKDR
jgi:hypothetical protein